MSISEPYASRYNHMTDRPVSHISWAKAPSEGPILLGNIRVVSEHLAHGCVDNKSSGMPNRRGKAKECVRGGGLSLETS